MPTESLRRPAAVAFGVNETLFPLDPLDAAFSAVGLHPTLRPLWFARTLRDGFALSAAGDYRPFPEVAAASLRSIAGGSLEDDAVGSVLAGFRDLDPHPDVEPALRRLRDAGVRVVTLTVGSADVTAHLLARAQLSAYVSATLSADAVRRWKPAPEPYLYAAGECGVPPGDLALVAAHAWDVHGARRAGLRTSWVSRLERDFPASFDRADVEGADVLSVVDALLTSS